MRNILHLDLDTFFVSVERLKDSRLAGKPILIGGFSDRAVVSSCSYEARGFGVRSGMPMRLARKLCPQAIVLSGDMDSYTRKSKEVTQVINDTAPLVEKASIDEFYIDLTGMDRFFGCYNWSKELKQNIITQTGLVTSFGLSANKTVSKVATGEGKPNGQLQINYGDEKPFLSPLSIRKLPMVGEVTYNFLHEMGIEKIGMLMEMPVEALERVLGKMGRIIWNKANGIDPSPVVPYHEQKSLGTETTFGQDTIDVVKMRALFVSMTEKLAYELRQKGQLCSCITVKIRYANFDTVTKQASIPYTSLDTTLIQEAKQLFDKLYDKRLRIRLIGVRFSKLVYGNYQIKLFEDSVENLALLQAMDKIRNRFGKNAIKRASGWLDGSYRHAIGNDSVDDFG